jgi:predicted nucleic acid-binding protein
MARCPATTLYLSVLTLDELRSGADGQPEGDRKHRLLAKSRIYSYTAYAELLAGS